MYFVVKFIIETYDKKYIEIPVEAFYYFVTPGITLTMLIIEKKREKKHVCFFP